MKQGTGEIKKNSSVKPSETVKLDFHTGKNDLEKGCSSYILACGGNSSPSKYDSKCCNVAV